jgi:dephospho-CoA kinase
MLVYGLTGGIGSGKSTVARLFAELGAVCLDADTLGHRLLLPDRPEGRAVAARFPDCLGPDGRLDRRALGARVFADREERAWLEERLHPAIRRELDEALAGLARPRPACCLVEGAVLLESRTRFRLCGLVVVHAPRSVRLERLGVRDGLPPAALEARLAAQLSPALKALRGTLLIDNGGSLADTRARVVRAWRSLGRECALPPVPERGEPA